jgi:hypothetical protein
MPRQDLRQSERDFKNRTKEIDELLATLTWPPPSGSTARRSSRLTENTPRASRSCAERSERRRPSWLTSSEQSKHRGPLRRIGNIRRDTGHLRDLARPPERGQPDVPLGASPVTPATAVMGARYGRLPSRPPRTHARQPRKVRPRNPDDRFWMNPPRRRVHPKRPRGRQAGRGCLSGSWYFPDPRLLHARARSQGVDALPAS